MITTERKAELLDLFAKAIDADDGFVLLIESDNEIALNTNYDATSLPDLFEEMAERSEGFEDVEGVQELPPYAGFSPSRRVN